MGGFLLDMDTICLQSLDELVYKFSFVGALEPASGTYESPAISGAFIGSSPNNEIIKLTIEKLDKYYTKSEGEFIYQFNQYGGVRIGKNTKD